MPKNHHQTPPGRIALDRFLPYRLSVLSNTVSGAIARLYAERFDLTMAEWRVMAVLGMAPGLSASQVCERTRMDKVQVSRAVRRLLAAGRLERAIDPADQRRSVLRMSPRGEAIYGQVAPLARVSEGELLDILSERELRALDGLLDKLQRRADDLAAGARSGAEAVTSR